MLDRARRLLRHRWFDDRTLRRTITPELLERLMRRIQASERRHSGEIRLCVEAGLPSSYLLRALPLPQLIRQRALALFGKLRVWDTEDNNGVLIYLLLAERAIEIVADRGVDRQVSPQQWQAMIARMRGAFQQGQFEQGLTQALEEISAVLVAHFPLTADRDDANELPDEPVIGTSLRP